MLALRRNHSLFLPLILSLLGILYAELSSPMNLNDAFNVMTTPIVASIPGRQSQGTAFFYDRLGPKKGEGPQWRTVDKVWLVTNRHVILPKVHDHEVVPSTLSFHLRKIEGDRLAWDPITLTAEELRRRTRLHPDPEVDVATIDVLDLLEERIKDEKAKYTIWYAVSAENLPGNNNINVEASDNVVVIGYPRGFYDKANLYPIIKSGIIASRWGANFDGKPFFLVDAKLFPGSSGSIVLSKPTDFVIRDGHPMFAKEKQFAFLGIYSGEPLRHERPVELEEMVIIEKTGYNVGVVWYGHLIDEIIEKGIPIPTASVGGTLGRKAP